MATKKQDIEVYEQPKEELLPVLKSSLYPGVGDAMIGAIVDYCKAAKLNPMLKPVHPVPMKVKDPDTGKEVWREVIMPGIGHYRTQADRSGTYAGLSEPEFGPEVTREFTYSKNNFTRKYVVAFPEWCKITAKKLLPNGSIAEFTVVERWEENYAATGGAPNSMWRKRPYGQLAKCAEAQVLRKAWPEIIGAAPTAEEMEGKEFEEREVHGEVVEEIKEPRPKSKAEEFVEEVKQTFNAKEAPPMENNSPPMENNSPPRAKPKPAPVTVDNETGQIAELPAGMQRMIRAAFKRTGLESDDAQDAKSQELFGLPIANLDKTKINDILHTIVGGV